MARLTFEAFSAALAEGTPEPTGLPPTLRALWLDRRGDWSAAHDLAGAIESPDGARIHAYLHRKEGDLANARYWYREADKPPFDGPLDAEWTTLARDLLGA